MIIKTPDRSNSSNCIALPSLEQLVHPLPRYYRSYTYYLPSSSSMDPSTLDQLEQYSDRLSATVQDLRAQMHRRERHEVDADARVAIAKIKATILACTEGIKALVEEPAEFLQRLTTHVRHRLQCCQIPSVHSSGAMSANRCRLRCSRASNCSLDSRCWRAFPRE